MNEYRSKIIIQWTWMSEKIHKNLIEIQKFSTTNYAIEWWTCKFDVKGQDIYNVICIIYGILSFIRPGTWNKVKY